MDERTSILSAVDIFSPLDESELGALAAYGEFREYSEGDVIFREHDPSREFYVLRSGRVLVRKTTLEGKELDLARYIPGEYFGEMEMFEEISRQATAVAEGAVSLFVFPSGGTEFRDVLERHPESGAQVLHRLLSLVAGRIRNANRLVSERTPWVEDLRRQLLVDKLTGLYNRTYLKDELPGLIRRYPDALRLAVMKPDNFKQINDVHGHAAGDEALKMIAGTVRLLMDNGPLSVRYRGDEFLVIFPGLSSAETDRRVETLKETSERLDFSHLAGGAPLSLTFSFGIAGPPDTREGADAFVAAAFERMLEARNAGGNRIVRPAGQEVQS